MAIIRLMPPDTQLVLECDEGGLPTFRCTGADFCASFRRSVEMLYSRGLFLRPEPCLYQPGKTLAVCSVCQLSYINGGEGLMLKLTDCLHLLSELCHMLECTSWLLLGQRRRPLLPLCSPVLFKWSAKLTFPVSLGVTATSFPLITSVYEHE